MLDTTLATDFVPGTNVKGDVAGASWSYMLPSLELDHIVCLGVPSQETMMTLARMGKDVLVFCKNERQLQRARLIRERRRLINVTVATKQAGRLPLTDGHTDLVLVCGRRWSKSVDRDRLEQAEIRRILRSSGAVYMEGWVSRGDPAAVRLNGSLGANLDQQLFLLTPRLGEAGTAVPVTDSKTIDYFARHKLECSTFHRRPFVRASEIVEGWPMLGRLGRRYCVLAGRPDAEMGEAPPKYLRALAAAAGVDIAAYRWGLSAPGRYTSRKVVLFLFAPRDERPRYVVKLTRDGAMNHRLENEHHALTRLARMQAVPARSVPKPVFAGHHGGLAIVGETAVEGVPLRQRSNGQPGCAFARAAVEWLTGLAAATADTESVAPSDAAAAVEVLLERFLHIYETSSYERGFLRDQVARIAAIDGAFPVVFQHGDPGVWNLLVRGDGEVAFLDWEAAEPDGMPLWDLFYLLRSFCMLGSDVRGGRARLEALARNFLSEAPHNELLVDATRRYVAALGMKADLIEPLFYTCWMHRALKEATRLPVNKLPSGHYRRLLGLAVEHHDRAGLERLFTP